MSKLTFEQARQLVAERHGFSSWTTIPIGAAEILTEGAAELLAQNWANEAVKEDRLVIAKKEYAEGSIDYECCLLSMRNIPLPYPEIDHD